MFGTRKAASLLRKSLCVAATGALVLAYTPVTAGAAPTTLTADISKGSVVIAGDALTYVDANGTQHEGVKFDEKTTIVVTGSTKENTVSVKDYDDCPINIVFKDLTIDVSGVPSESGAGFESMCAVYFGGESTSWCQGRVNLTLEGSNTIKSLDYAGIAVPVGETLTIDGTGSLDVSTSVGNASTCAPAIGSTVSNNNPPAYILGESVDGGLGTIIINGGNINATSECTGIGGGQGVDGGTISINGGTVTATAASASAAGIGWGQDSTAGSVTITGGTVTATGANAGTGIGGGGMHTNGGVITITGGNVTAYGGNYAAGIGGSNVNSYGHGDADITTITGGVIKAYGGKGAAGIGGGAPYGLCGTVTITGGDITAQGGDGTASSGDKSMMGNVYGTGVTVYGAGAGIGNGGCYFSSTTYLIDWRGTPAGTVTTSGTARFGGKVTITGGTVRAVPGGYDSDSSIVIAQANLSLVDAQAIGNGAYDATMVTEDNPYTECALATQGGTVFENGTQVYPKPSASTNTTKAATPAKVSLRAKKTASAKKGQLTVAWKAAKNAKKYQVAYKVKGGKWQYKSTKKLTLTLKSLKKGKKYVVKVRGLNGSVGGKWSATKTVQVKKK